jgi:chorismate-pyruvate lyase
LRLDPTAPSARARSVAVADRVDEASDFIRALGSLAWPVLALTALLVSRRPLGDRLASARRLKAGPFEAEWDARLAETQAQVPVVRRPYSFKDMVVARLPDALKRPRPYRSGAGNR